MKVTFHAQLVAVDDMEDYWQVGFVDDEFDWRDYLMLQRGYEDDEQDIALGMDTYYVERNDQGWSCYGGIETFELYRDRVLVTFNAKGRQRLDTDEMEITFKPDGRRFRKLKNRLERIFAGSNCLVA